ncbi:MAG TPA: hypothetical protein VHN77_06220 [Phycisphaerales bacterium]|nr:hypothetical protein [Phycisphaerales bacterium]
MKDFTGEAMLAAASGDWNVLGASLALAEACGEEIDALVRKRCHALSRLDACLKRPVSLDHPVFVNAVTQVLGGNHDRPELAVRTFGGSAAAGAAPLCWADGAHGRAAPIADRPMFLHVRVCDPSEPDAVVLARELRRGGIVPASECARSLWELWADALPHHHNGAARSGGAA